jgi:hypothetical protein
VGGRLVQQQVLRLLRQRACEVYPLAFAPTELANRARGEVVNLHQRHRLLHGVPVGAGCSPEALLVRVASHHHQFGDREAHLGRGLLGGVGDAPCEFGGAVGVVGLPIQRQPTREWRKRACQHAQQCRLARPVRSQQREDLPPRDLQRRLLHYRRTPVARCDTLRAQHPQ